MILYDMALDQTSRFSSKEEPHLNFVYLPLFNHLYIFISVKHDIWAITQYYGSPITPDYVVTYSFYMYTMILWECLWLNSLIWHAVYCICTCMLLWWHNDAWWSGNFPHLEWPRDTLCYLGFHIELTLLLLYLFSYCVRLFHYQALRLLIAQSFDTMSSALFPNC